MLYFALSLLFLRRAEPAKEHDEGVRKRRTARQVTFQEEYSEKEEGNAVVRNAHALRF